MNAKIKVASEEYFIYAGWPLSGNIVELEARVGPKCQSAPCTMLQKILIIIIIQRFLIQAFFTAITYVDSIGMQVTKFRY